MPWLERLWRDRNPASLALWPLAALFGLITGIRRQLFTSGLLKAHRSPVPVVVVGNISVGGTGKTPLILWLCEWLRQQGLHPGIVSRGYGGDRRLREVSSDSDPDRVGDEPLLLARRSGVPVFVSPRRAEAARELLQAHPECDVILSDDGLQHYQLARDIEVAVIDGRRGFGNRLLLPAGPLREPVSRLRHFDAVVVNGAGPIDGLPSHSMSLRGETFVSLTDARQMRTPVQLQGARLHAVAGIGDPQRFFRHLSALGLQVTPHPFPDHHRYTRADLAFDAQEIVLMTEKDAVKCAAFAHPNWWYLPVDAVVDPALGDTILAKLRLRHGSQAA